MRTLAAATIAILLAGCEGPTGPAAEPGSLDASEIGYVPQPASPAPPTNVEEGLNRSLTVAGGTAASLTVTGSLRVDGAIDGALARSRVVHLKCLTNTAQCMPAPCPTGTMCANCPGSGCEATCGTGYFVLGGGCYSANGPGVQAGCFPSSESSWIVNGGTSEVYAICGQLK